MSIGYVSIITYSRQRFFPKAHSKLCVLEQLERALKCREVWGEGSYAFRNASEDMPRDWSDEPRRLLHYEALGKQTFVRVLKVRMVEGLTAFNRILPQLSHVRMFHPKKQEERGLWALANLYPDQELFHVGNCGPDRGPRPP